MSYVQKKLDFPEEFQDKVLSLVVYSTDFISRVRDLLQPEHFVAREQWIVCTLAYKYFDEWLVAPGTNLRHEIAKHIDRSHMAEDDERLLDELWGDLDPDAGPEDYVLGEILRFVQHEGVRKALEEFIPEYNEGDYDLDTFMDSVSDVQRKVMPDDGSLDVLASVLGRVSRRKSGTDQVKLIATLIDKLDDRMLGILPGQLGTIMAPAGIGKTFMMVHLGKAALLQGKRVYHYTLEMSAEEIVARYDQMIVGLEADHPRYARQLVSRATKLARRGGKLQVVYLPVGSTAGTLKRDLRRRSERVGAPEMILVDYGEELRKSSKDLYTEMGEIWRELKGIAVEMGVALWVATQTSRAGVGLKRISEIEVADSYEKVRVSDIYIGFNRNIIMDKARREWREEDAEHNPNMVRLFMIKHRGRIDKYHVKFVCDLDRGLFYCKKATDVLDDLERRGEDLDPDTLKMFDKFEK